jgi:hypothetical protein
MGIDQCPAVYQGERMNGRFYARLRNWGDWLCYDASIGPMDAVCISIESRHIPEAGEVWEDDPEPAQVIPDVTDAEAIHALVRQLDTMEQICLAMRYGGLPAVFRPRRISEHAQKRMADNAEILLFERLKKSA